MKFILLTFFILQFGHINFAQNVEIIHFGNPTEPSIMLDPKNPDNLVAGSNLDYYYTSSDAGHTWTINQLNSSFGVWGDPCIDVDTLSNFYFFHLSNPSIGGSFIDRIVCQKSTDNGSTWSDGSFTGLNGIKAQDKQWSVVDRNNNNIYLTWTQFDDYGSANPADSSIILFSKSTDQGITWSNPIRINSVAGDCIDSDNTVEGAVPAVGPNGEIYVSWAGPNGIVFNRSTDQGDTWLSHEILIDVMPGGWDLTIPGIYRANGLPITKCDLSSGPNHGTIYVNWSDQRNGPDDTDIWLSKSTDGGDTWSPATRVNDDLPNKHQFFTWMDIDQTNGNLLFLFYDRRNHSFKLTDVYIALSTDAGITFENRKISETPFLPNEFAFFGDYTNIVAHNNKIHPIWTRLDGAELTVWTDVTPLDQILGVDEDELANQDYNEALNYPNPSSNLTYVSFKLHEESTVDLMIYNEAGELVFTEREGFQMGVGKHIIPLNFEGFGMGSGTYFIHLLINDESEILRSIYIR